MILGQITQHFTYPVIGRLDRPIHLLCVEYERLCRHIMDDPVKPGHDGAGEDS